jgi:hypothetical protein
MMKAAEEKHSCGLRQTHFPFAIVDLPFSISGVAHIESVNSPSLANKWKMPNLQWQMENGFCI